MIGPIVKIEPLEWAAETAFGMRTVRFSEINAFGVLDHAVYAKGETPVMMPMRVTANGECCDLIFLFLRRPGMTDEQFQSALPWIETDFLTLKSMLESVR